MDKIYLQVLVSLFSGVLAFMIANVSVSYMFPIFDSLAGSFGFMAGGIDYVSVSGVIKNAFFIAIFIVVCIPIAYLLMRLIRKEPEAQQQQYYPYYPGA